MFSLLEGFFPEETFDFNANAKSRLNDILFGNLKADEVVETCEDLDVFDIFKIIHKVNAELRNLSLENLVLENFLEVNDPKLLFGVTDKELANDINQIKSETGKIKFDSTNDYQQKGSREKERTSNPSLAMSAFKKSNASQSTFGMKTKEYRLNYKSKVELADKLSRDVRSKIKNLERDLCLDVRRINSEIEEVRYDIKEANNCLDSFNRNVVFLGRDPNTGVIRAEIFTKFFKSFYNTGLGLMSNFKITSNNIQQEIVSLRKNVFTKKEMGGVLTSVDFDRLMIVKVEETKTSEDQMNTVSFLKAYHGKVSYSLSVKRKELLELEMKLKSLQNKIETLKKSVSSIEKEFEVVEKEMSEASVSLTVLQKQMHAFTAPKIFDYIALKEELSSLDKEKKKLKQNIYLLRIHAKNAHQKYKSSN